MRAGMYPRGTFLSEARAGVALDLARQALAHGLTLADLESALLERSLEESRGNLAAAARQVGLTRRALEYRLARRRDADEETSGR